MAIVSRSVERMHLSAAQCLWTMMLLAFIAVIVYGKLDWWPVLLPSAVLTWYGGIRSGSTNRREDR